MRFAAAIRWLVVVIVLGGTGVAVAQSTDGYTPAYRHGRMNGDAPLPSISYTPQNVPVAGSQTKYPLRMQIARVVETENRDDGWSAHCGSTIVASKGTLVLTGADEKRYSFRTSCYGGLASGRKALVPYVARWKKPDAELRCWQGHRAKAR
jgi:hypothetical protein